MLWSSQNKKRNSNSFSKVSKSLRKKASQAGYKVANVGGYVAGRTSAKIAKTPKLRNTVGRAANKLPKTKPPRISIRTQAAITKGLASGASDSIRSSYRRNSNSSSR